LGIGDRVQKYASGMLREQEFRSSEVQKFRSSEVQKFRSSEVQKFRSSEVQKYASGTLREQEYASGTLREQELKMSEFSSDRINYSATSVTPATPVFFFGIIL
jgi:hypothetical protein